MALKEVNLGNDQAKSTNHTGLFGGRIGAKKSHVLVKALVSR